MSKIKINKNVLYAIIITVIVTFAIAYIIFSYYPEMQKTKTINSYKKSMYDSVLCQYKCPVDVQITSNKTQYYPNPECVKNCTTAFTALEKAPKSFTDDDLANDNLINDMGKAVNDCGKELNASLESKMNCAVTNFIALKPNYKYLN